MTFTLSVEGHGPGERVNAASDWLSFLLVAGLTAVVLLVVAGLMLWLAAKGRQRRHPADRTATRSGRSALAVEAGGPDGKPDGVAGDVQRARLDARPEGDSCDDLVRPWVDADDLSRAAVQSPD